MRKLYMAVTRDRFELPVAVADSAQELARMVGVSKRTIERRLSDNKHHPGRRSIYHRVLVEDNDEETLYGGH